MSRITFIARMTAAEGREAELCTYFRDFEAYVSQHEPRTIWYEFFRLREPRRFAVIESFADDTAEALHMSSPKLAELGPKISSCLVGTWEREYFDPL
jgi:(4S)-4-hydroxy-5-phosphonooxypentane-2,3-dione isomerase